MPWSCLAPPRLPLLPVVGSLQGPGPLAQGVVLLQRSAAHLLPGHSFFPAGGQVDHGLHVAADCPYSVQEAAERLPAERSHSCHGRMEWHGMACHCGMQWKQKVQKHPSTRAAFLRRSGSRSSGNVTLLPSALPTSSCLVVAVSGRGAQLLVVLSTQNHVLPKGCSEISWHYKWKSKKDPEKRWERRVKSLTNSFLEGWKVAAEAALWDRQPQGLPSLLPLFLSAPQVSCLQFKTPPPPLFLPQKHHNLSKQRVLKQGRQPGKAEEQAGSLQAPTVMA